MSRHTMDVDNTHWPGDPECRGENNQAVEWFRRLYLAVWNLTEVYDATKDAKYKADLEDRVARMLTQARANGDVLAIERYGYSQVYAAHGLHRYHLVTGDAAVRDALVRHARRERDVPSLNHWMESYLASLFPLAIGYDLSGEPSLREEAVRRARTPNWDPLHGLRFFGWTTGHGLPWVIGLVE